MTDDKENSSKYHISNIAEYKMMGENDCAIKYSFICICGFEIFVVLEKENSWRLIFADSPRGRDLKEN
jgi:hypothetical protein